VPNEWWWKLIQAERFVQTKFTDVNKLTTKAAHSVISSLNKQFIYTQNPFLCLPWRHIQEGQVQLQSLLTLAADGSQWSVPCPGHISATKTALGSHWKWGLLSPKASQDIFQRHNSCPIQDLNLYRPAHCPIQGWWSYGMQKDFLGTQHSLLSVFFISFAWPESLYCEEYGMYVCMGTYICIYMHIWLCTNCIRITAATKQFCMWSIFT